MKYLLGIDVGTTGTKTLLFREDGKLLGSAARGYALSTPQVGYSEQDPEDWWNAIVDTVQEVMAGRDISADDVTGISLSTQGGTFVPTDERGVPLRPAIVWNDNRCTGEREAFLREVGPSEYMYQKTGWKLSKALLALAIRWFKDHEADLFEKTAGFLSVPDFISMRMTGIAAADLSNLGINQLCDIRREAYDEKILEFDGITADRLPKILHSGDRIGRLTPEAAKQLGLTTETVLVAGAHDQYAAALGAGAINNGDIMVGSGTSWVVLAIDDAPDFVGQAQSVAAVPGKWGSLLSLSSGGVCVEWLRNSITTGSDGKKLDYNTINNEVAKRKAAENGLFFFPFSGLVSESKRFSRASFIGLDLSHDRFDIARAVMEGVAFQTVWMAETFKTRPSKEGLILSGGASKSLVWSQMLAEIAGIPVRIPEIADLSCVGAAILAGVGSGVFADIPEGCDRLKIAKRVIEPDPSRVEIYKPLFTKFKESAELLGKLYGL